MSRALESPPSRSGHLRLVSLLAVCAVVLGPRSAAAHWPPPSESDGVYGRLRGDTDASLKLGGLISHSQLSASLGASAHYYSLVGITGDYSESLDADAGPPR